MFLIDFRVSLQQRIRAAEVGANVAGRPCSQFITNGADAAANPAIETLHWLGLLSSALQA
jgi:hypothetical protein